jgi:hypothetical protein
MARAWRFVAAAPVQPTAIRIASESVIDALRPVFFI